jgi:hypothetical protein
LPDHSLSSSFCLPASAVPLQSESISMPFSPIPASKIKKSHSFYWSGIRQLKCLSCCYTLK